MRRLWLLALILASVLVLPAVAAEPDLSATTVESLVDALTGIDETAPGISGAGWYDGFIADDSRIEFQGGLLGGPTPSIPPAMRELVRRGATALPVLIQHLLDPRPTKLTVRPMMWGYFGKEYVPRWPEAPRSIAARNAVRHESGTPLEGEYTVKVGDVCYVVIGQIVNRRLWSVRYQASGGLVVNSPIETPILKDWIVQDWGHLDAARHRAQLLADIRRPDARLGASAAFVRLRFYYPVAYQSLSGKNLERRIAFEAAEQAAENRERARRETSKE